MARIIKVVKGRKPVRSISTVSDQGSRYVVPGRPDVLIFRGDTPTVGSNGTVQLLLELPPFTSNLEEE
jgi:hypothetical protein